MNRLVKFACLAMGLLLVGSAVARDVPESRYLTDGTHTVLTNAGTSIGTAARDTIYLMGGDGDWSGKFETPGGTPTWHDWTHYDNTAPLSGYWHVDTYHMENLNDNGTGNHGVWCGSILFPACPGETEPGGYGNGWSDGLDYWGTVADPGLSTNVDIDFYYNVDTENGWDYFNLNIDRAGTWDQQLHVSGILVNEHYTTTIVFTPEDYVDGYQFHIQFQVTSDSNTSDEDCQRPSSGAVQIDDITVSGSNSVVTYFEDFEGGSLGDWVPTGTLGVGDFSKLWMNLMDIDECGSNSSTQVAFIDDGIVVPGTGGQMCITWCYGPGGYIVNTTGGLTGGHLNNTIQSPPLPWPDGGYEGATLRFDVYRHYPVAMNHSGIHYGYAVGSTDTGDPADLPLGSWSGWVVLSPGDPPEYIRHEIPVSDLLVPGRTHVQTRLFIYEMGWLWGLDGDDGTPAPYFDNVAFLVYDFDGPVITAREIDLAQDTFPASGDIDYDDLSNNSCRFDAALNIAPPAHLGNDPGDSIVIEVTPLRAGSELTNPPRLYYKIRPNWLFNGVRLQPPGPNGFIEGFVEGDSAVGGSGVPIPGKWAIDLPDTGFFFPGDVMHYYLTATDDPGGDPRTATLPADTSGFSDFNTLLAYSSSYIVHFLPTVFSSYPGDHPKILWWNDFGDLGGQNEWYSALGNTGFLEGFDFDTYYTNGPSSGVGNGLGGRASAAQLDGYDAILYTSGDLSDFTISNGDPNYDAGNDVGVLDTWLQDGDRNMFLTGDNLAYDLANSGSAPLAFLTNWIGVDHQVQSIRPIINNQTAPYVRITPSNPVFWSVEEWIAFGGCPGINTFDGVVTTTATRIAEFLTPDGQGGAYPYAAATYNEVAGFDNQFVYLPYDFAYIYTAPGNHGFPARAKVVADVLLTFDMIGGGFDPVPAPDVFAVRNFPNPFNPQTNIEFTLPQRDHVTVKIYNLRGALLRTLVDDVRDAGVVHEVIWNGTDDRGAEVSSGLYFYEVKSGGMTKVSKMTLVK